jgi:hypothetical protein
MTISLRARLILLFVSIVLFIPILGITIERKPELENFHQRVLPDWPKSGDFLHDPAQYFADAKSWLSFRVWPIIDVSIFQKTFLLSALGTPPQRRVTLAANGFVFLNGTDDGHINNILQNVCVRAHSEELTSAFAAALPRVAAYAKAIGLPIDVEVYPTPETLYGDHLPLSVPLTYRQACAARAAGNSPLTHIASPEGLNYLFPFAQMHAARDDEAFFPKANWHPDGLSLKIGRDAYLKTLGLTGQIHESLIRTESPSELLTTYGIVQNTPIYRIDAPTVSDDAEGNEKMRAAIIDLFLNPRFFSNAYRNSDPISNETLLILSDSYGNLASKVYAGAFRRVFQIMANDTRPDTAAEMIRRINDAVGIDRVLVMMQEGNLDRVVDYAATFDKTVPVAVRR